MRHKPRQSAEPIPKATLPPEGVVSDTPQQQLPDLTVVSDPLDESLWARRADDATSAEPRPYDEGQLASSAIQAADKYGVLPRCVAFLNNSVNLIALIAVLTVGYIFIQDNAEGRVENWEGMLWTLTKCGVLVGLMACVAFIAVLVNRIRAR